MGALFIPNAPNAMHRDGASSAARKSIAGSYVFTLEGNAWRAVTKLVLLYVHAP
jgi:hypothetical protein